MKLKAPDGMFVEEQLRQYAILVNYAVSIDEVEGLAYEVFRSMIRELKSRNDQITKDEYTTLISDQLKKIHSNKLTQQFWTSWSDFVWTIEESQAA